MQELIQEGKFREDLYYRLNVIPIFIPPLREHKEDIPELTIYFMNLYYEESGKKPKRFSKEAMNALMDYDWPGNVRQLKNVVERIMIMISHDEVMEQDVKWALNIKQNQSKPNGCQRNRPEKICLICLKRK